MTRAIQTLLIFLASTAFAHAQSAISIPWVGLAPGPLGELRYVTGVAGSFIKGEIAAEGVLSSACSAEICLAKTSEAILSIRVGEETIAVKDQIPDGPAVFALNGNLAWIYFQSSGVLAEWKNGIAIPVAHWSDSEGEVLSMRVVDGRLQLAVRRNGQVWIVRTDGSVIDTLPASGTVLLIGSAKIYSSGDELVIRRDDASEVRLHLREVQSIAAMGSHYAHVVAADGTYALRTDAGREGLFLLPGAAPALENEARPRRR